MNAFLPLLSRGIATAIAAASPTLAAASDAEIVAALDVEYQAAVEANDAATMDRILHDDFVLVTGRGRAFTKEELLAEARERSTVYRRQEATDRTVRLSGDTAVVTALLHVEGVRDGQPVAYRVWYSDTYVRTRDGWRYFFGQSAQRLADGE